MKPKPDWMPHPAWLWVNGLPNLWEQYWKEMIVVIVASSTAGAFIAAATISVLEYMAN